MELLIKALADMKTQDANKQLEQYLLQQLSNSKVYPDNDQQNKNTGPQTNHPTLNCSQIQLQTNNQQQNDFDTTLTNDFDSTLFSTLNNIQQDVQRREQNEHNNKIDQNGSQKLSGKKLINFRQKALQQDDVVLENVQAVVVPTVQHGQNKKYTFKQYKQEVDETPSQEVQKKYFIKQNYNQQQPSQKEEPRQEQKTYILKKPAIKQQPQTKKSKKPEKKVQQEPKQIIQIVHMPQKQIKREKQPPQEKQRPKINQNRKINDNLSPMVIKEQIIKKKAPQKDKKHDKMDLAMDIAALVAAEYEKQIQKFNEEEGNKSVKSQQLRELSMLINESFKPQENVQQKKKTPVKQLNTQKSFIDSIPSCISDGEIWPKYDLKGAQQLQEKGRGIGAWDRSITTDWQEPNHSQLSEGEINIYNKLIDSLNDFQY